MPVRTGVWVVAEVGPPPVFVGDEGVFVDGIASLVAPTLAFGCPGASIDRMSTVRVLITDDEPAGRASVRALLARDTRAEVVAECATGPETVRAILDHHPDLLFLDVQLPGQSGIAALSEIPEALRPVVIFVTAHDAHALRAFDFETADYLLKPYSDARFRKALDRGIARLDRARVTDLRRQLLEIAEGLDDRGEVATARQATERLPVRIGGGVRLIDLNEVMWIEAVRDYARLHTRNGEYLLRTTMAALEQRLDPSRFVRIHRSTISNVAFVSELHGAESGESEVVLRTGKRLRASERGRRVLLRALHVDA